MDLKLFKGPEPRGKDAATGAIEEHMNESAAVLLVDDDRDILELLHESLTAFGFRTVAVSDGSGMFAELEKQPFDCILLDIMMPGEDGLSLCRRLRTPGAPYEHTPVIFLTALGELTDRVVGLELGGDDYLPKPFQTRELVARIRALLRRAAAPRQGETFGRPGVEAGQGNGVWSFGQWKLKVLSRHLVDREGVVVPLSSAEFKLLMLFLETPQQVISRDAILEHMADRSPDVYDRSIDVQISRLRAKLHDNARNPELIRTMRGDGYMFTARVDRSAHE